MPEALPGLRCSRQWEAQRKAGLDLKAKLGPRLVWVAASTHAGEEEQSLAAFKTIKTRIPQCLLILVPRHPDRFNEVMKLLDKHGMSYICRSKGTECTPDTEVLMGDTMGEMNIFYAAADLAFVGGSLIDMGGHNLLEPAALGVPSLTGPYFSNFKEITEKLLQAGGLCVVQDREQLAAKVIEWLELNSASRKEIGARGLAVIEQNRGAISNLMSIITTLLSYQDRA